MNNWFESRNLKVLAYQTDTINKVKDSLSSQEITVLAACPSAGKTIMAIHCIEDFLRKNPNSKVIVLAHGTTVLRTQFHDVLEEIKPDFTYKLADNFNEYDETKAVNVCLPQTLNRKSLTKIDLLVVDEAHQFYFGEKMVKDIIKKTKPRRQLLLTGTPSIFIREKHPIIPVTLNTIFDEGMVSDVYVEIATSSYNFDIYDYNFQNELKEEVLFKDSETKKTLDDLIAKIVERLKSIRGNEYVNLLPEWLPTLKRLQKTMIACKSQRQAIQVKNYFDKIDVKSALSISDIDYDSIEIENFKADPDCLILIVVGRGILGFNYPELVNVVDMTTSMNVDRVYQLFCRVVRKHPNGLQKLFFKVAPNTLSDYYKYVMTGVLALSDEYYFTHFNGKNFNDMQIPVRPHVNNNGGSNNTNDNTTPVPNRKKPIKRLSPIDFSALPVFELFKDIYHKKDSLLHTYAFTTIRNVRAEFMKVKPNHYYEKYTKEELHKVALEYNSRKEFNKGNWNACNVAFKNGWLDEFFTRKVKPKVYHKNMTKEEICEIATEYDSIKEFQRGNITAYQVAFKNGWLDEFFTRKKKPNGYYKNITKEELRDIALKFNSRMKFRSSNSTAYQVAFKNGWIDEFFERKQKPKGYWQGLTKEELREVATEYDSRMDFMKGNISAYIVAVKMNWIDEFFERMKKPNGFYKNMTKEEIKNIATEYSTREEFQNSNNGAYQVALTNDWIDEIFERMKKPNGFYKNMTKEKMREIALEYDSISEFVKGNNSAYNVARKMNWIDEFFTRKK
jgi:superfamily II DNA or RNA helicase